MFKNINRSAALAGGALTAVLALPVHAASVLPSDIDTTFTDAQADIVKVVGLALGLVLTIVVWRYVRRAAS